MQNEAMDKFNDLRMSESELIAVLQESRLFDIDYYISQSDLDLEQVFDPLLHYIRIGAKQNLNPHPLFDTAFYKTQVSELAETDINPLLHFLRSGSADGLSPHRYFDTSLYLSLYPDVKESGKNPLIHYLRHGSKEGRRANDWFDAEFYFACFPNLKEGGQDALEHYTRSGSEQESDFAAALLIRDSGFFDVSFYETQQGDNLKNELGPIMHYIRNGAPRMLNPNPLFDTSYYFDKVPALLKSKENPLVHFIRCGVKEGLDPHPYFDTAFYLENNKDMSSYRQGALHHYLFHGAQEGRNPNNWFDSRFYAEKFPEVQAFGINPLIHYVRFGEADGRYAKPKNAYELSPEATKHYLALRRMEPLLPPLIALSSLPVYSYSKPCSEAEAYLKLGKLLKKAFDYLLVVGKPHDKVTQEALNYTLRDISEGALILSIDSNPTLPHFVDSKKVQVIDFEKVFPELAIAQRVSVLLRLIIQAQPRVVHNYESTVCWQVFEKYHKQIKANTLCYASLCDWRIDDEGVESGEFTRSFNACVENLDKIFIPGENELARLTQLFYLPEFAFSRIVQMTPSKLPSTL